MRSPNELGNFIRLGETLYLLRNSQSAHAEIINSTIDNLVTALNRCGIQQGIDAAAPFSRHLSIPYFSLTGQMTPVAIGQVNSWAEAVGEAVYRAADQTQIIALNQGVVTQRVRHMNSGGRLNSQQEQLHEEVINCLERGTYRAAMVMGWNLVYDIIRRWVFDDPQRQQTMNQDLGQRPNNPIQIAQYEDFFSGDPGERQFIDLCHRVGFIREPIRDDLRHYLRMRNNYAHPSFVHPDGPQATAYVAHLLDLIEAPPFNF